MAIGTKNSSCTFVDSSSSKVLGSATLKVNSATEGTITVNAVDIPGYQVDGNGKPLVDGSPLEAATINVDIQKTS